jgi:hypothetical protein
MSVQNMRGMDAGHDFPGSASLPQTPGWLSGHVDYE